jgi:hypothetical protein
MIAQYLPIGLRMLLGMAVLTALVLVGAPAGSQSGDPATDGEASGAPGDKAVWTEADKDGFGTSTTTGSKV